MLDSTKVTKASPSQEKSVFWAKMFNATTQEEFDMLATENQLASTMSDAMKKFYEQKNIADQCRAREDYYNRQRAINDLLVKQASELRNKDSELKTKYSELKAKDSRIAELEALLADKDSQ